MSTSESDSGSTLISTNIWFLVNNDRIMTVFWVNCPFKYQQNQHDSIIIYSKPKKKQVEPLSDSDIMKYERKEETF